MEGLWRRHRITAFHGSQRGSAVMKSRVGPPSRALHDGVPRSPSAAEQHIVVSTQRRTCGRRERTQCARDRVVAFAASDRDAARLPTSARPQSTAMMRLVARGVHVPTQGTNDSNAQYPRVDRTRMCATSLRTASPSVPGVSRTTRTASTASRNLPRARATVRTVSRFPTAGQARSATCSSSAAARSRSAKSAATKSSASNGRRSSTPSPMPT